MNFKEILQQAETIEFQLLLNEFNQLATENRDVFSAAQKIQTLFLNKKRDFFTFSIDGITAPDKFMEELEPTFAKYESLYGENAGEIFINSGLADLKDRWAREAYGNSYTDSTKLAQYSSTDIFTKIGAIRGMYKFQEFYADYNAFFQLNSSVFPTEYNEIWLLSKIKQPTKRIKVKNAEQQKIYSLKFDEKKQYSIPFLHKELKLNGYIECNLIIFRKIFNSTEPFTPVDWKKSQRSLLYFIKGLAEVHQFITVSPDESKYKQIAECFTVCGSKLSPEVLRREYNEVKATGIIKTEMAKLDRLLKISLKT